MSFRVKITAWVVTSGAALAGVLMFSAYLQLEEELREGRVDSHHPQHQEWKLHNSYSEAEIQDIMSEIGERWLWVSIPAILLSLGAGLLLAKRALRPVHDINRQIAAMRPDALHGGIHIPESDPNIANLVDHLNSLLDKAGTAYQEMAEFSSRVAHELRTPLMLLRLRLERAPASMPSDFQEELQDELTRLSRFVERSMIAARAERGSITPVVEPLHLSELLQDIVADYQMLAAERELQLDLEVANSIKILADPDLLRQLLHGLMENAIRYGQSTVSVRCQQHAHETVLEISNDFDAANLPTPGLGLGLRLVRGICMASGFQFRTDQQGNRFNINVRFPEVAG